MNEQSTIDAAVKRLALALDALDAAVERRRDSDQDEETLAQQLHDLGTDRSRLAAALDGETSRARKLEATNREIAGRQYRLACEDGQEDHLLALAKDIDTRIIDLRRKFGEIGDTRLTVMAALMLADEMTETRQKFRVLEDEIVALREARETSADRARAASDAVIGAFHSAAERIEGITRKLNETVGAGAAPIG